MKTYLLTDARHRHREVFDQAIQAPVLLTKNSQLSHVIVSAQTYQMMVDRLADLEDLIWGTTAHMNLGKSKMVGIERFTTELAQLANYDF
jgi:PHD/YefM family antitoxin component YafN of YafNO toxin-antitoxin module